jgi:hypothetical protein
MRLRNLFLSLLVIMVVFACLVSPVDAKKKKKAKKSDKAKKEKPGKSSPKKPEGTSAELYCNACQAIVKESLKKLKHRKSEAEVFHVMNDVCDPKYYYIY